MMTQLVKAVSMLVAIAFIAIAVLASTGCGKVGVSGSIDRVFGSWAAVKLPDGCVAKQIAADEHGGVSVLCEDGRVFH